MTESSKRRRMFIGIMCPDDIWQPWQQRLALLGYSSVLSQPHITLAFLGGLSDRKLTEVINALGAVQSQKFTQQVAGGGYFSLKRQTILWAKAIPNVPLFQLRERILAALTPLHLQFETKFVPHISLVRTHRRHLDQCQTFLNQVDDLRFDFTVNAFGVYESLPTHAAPKYRLVEKYSLK